MMMMMMSELDQIGLDQIKLKMNLERDRDSLTMGKKGKERKGMNESGSTVLYRYGHVRYSGESLTNRG